MATDLNLNTSMVEPADNQTSAYLAIDGRGYSNAEGERYCAVAFNPDVYDLDTSNDTSSSGYSPFYDSLSENYTIGVPRAEWKVDLGKLYRIYNVTVYLNPGTYVNGDIVVCNDVNIC